MIFAAQVGAAVNLRRVEFPTVSGLSQSVETPIEPSGPSPIGVGGLPIVFMAKLVLTPAGHDVYGGNHQSPSTRPAGRWEGQRSKSRQGKVRRTTVIVTGDQRAPSANATSERVKAPAAGGSQKTTVATLSGTQVFLALKAG